jgi:hypothetical protein
MNNVKKFVTIILFCIVLPGQAQISHGGTPLFLPEIQPDSTHYASTNLRNATGLFIEMPAFDVNEMLEEDQLNESNMKGAFRFAKKFFVDIEKGKSGRHFTLNDGTKVWQAGIRSRGAHSINVLFSEYRIPEGGRLFLYSADGGHVLGSFTNENNSDNNLLPIAPVQGDEIIVEYSEPANAPFPGRLKITEVNHDYRGVLRAEPFNDPASAHSCMPDVLCTVSPLSREKDAVVLLIIDGIHLCTGSLINNLKNDETPYVLTAMHCLNHASGNNPLTSKTEDYYQQSAGSIVAFFNYNRPVCGTQMKGVEEMSVAGAGARCVIEQKDIVLLEMHDSIPDCYQAYYAGWNASTNIGTPPYTNIHHPYGSVKKFGETTQPLSMGSFSESLFDSNSFWKVPRWTTGSTRAGSSGSPLFDAGNRIIGALTGGSSECSGTAGNGMSDQFSSLNKGWEYNAGNYFHQLKRWLDPDGAGTLTCPGLDPLTNNPFEQKINIDLSAIDSLESTRLSAPGTGYLFGYNSLQIQEFAEEFHVNGEKTLYGVYTMNPPFNNSGKVEIVVYGVDTDRKPGAQICSVAFQPKYTNHASNQFWEDNKSAHTAGTESFVSFPQKIVVRDTFFVGYKITYPAVSSSRPPFSAYHAWSGQATAWVNYPDVGWIRTADIPGQPKPASLAIRALLRNGSDGEDSVIVDMPAVEKHVHYDKNRQVVRITCEPDDAGVLRLYSVSGRLIRQYAHRGPAEFGTPSIMKNTLVILQWKSEKHTETSKVILN